MRPGIGAGLLFLSAAAAAWAGATQEPGRATELCREGICLRFDAKGCLERSIPAAACHPLAQEPKACEATLAVLRKAAGEAEGPPRDCPGGYTLQVGERVAHVCLGDTDRRAEVLGRAWRTVGRICR